MKNRSREKGGGREGGGDGGGSALRLIIIGLTVGDGVVLLLGGTCVFGGVGREDYGG